MRADATADRDAPTGEQLTLPRGQIVIFGGDEVYPVARVDDYQDRFVGPYKAALPWTDPPESTRRCRAHPRLLAIPGNHDWYDGLTGFMRVFGQQAWIGGRQTVQTRSYFAAALPGRWWLWGIDIQSDAYLDSAQIRYFRDVGTEIARRRSADPVHGKAELGRRPRTRRVPQPRLRRTQPRARPLRGRADDLG